MHSRHGQLDHYRVPYSGGKEAGWTKIKAHTDGQRFLPGAVMAGFGISEDLPLKIQQQERTEDPQDKVEKNNYVIHHTQDKNVIGFFVDDSPDEIRQMSTPAIGSIQIIHSVRPGRGDHYSTNNYGFMNQPEILLQMMDSFTGGNREASIASLNFFNGQLPDHFKYQF
tara:strand:- start:197 stop:700 length:504 start_codon:yes stop_codon:yes gene_type:complete